MAIGPDGGDARSLASTPGEPRHLFLGSTTGWIFESMDGGSNWNRLSRLDSAEDNLVVDDIVVDPANRTTVYAAAWRLGQTGGGLWISHDSARSWTPVEALHGQSIRSFVVAPSDPKILFAGTLEGVYQSENAGASWKLISPPGSQEIHEIESLAVDPHDPRVVYAGTWHLPWKTTDGGLHWHSLKEGVIDDSDVFSIVIDPVIPQTVYLSACSGIYKSENGGAQFHKIQGIPASARRTRVLMLDPQRRGVVYAGTTEGLYRSLDAGKSFQRMTGPEVIVNDIWVDPSSSRHLLLATDRSGVLQSKDEVASLAESNHGFSSRMVHALLADRANSSRLFAGLVNDKQFGGVYRSNDGGRAWSRMAEGLDGNDVFSLSQAPDGTIVAGTNRGIFVLNAEAGKPPVWGPRNRVVNPPASSTTKSAKLGIKLKSKPPLLALAGRISALDCTGEVWAAATADGVFTSRDRGASWQGGAVLWLTDYVTVAAHDSTLAAARLDAIALSTNAGQSWRFIAMPSMDTVIHRLAFDAQGNLWMAAREGVYLSRDKGQSWLMPVKLPLNAIDDVEYDAGHGRVLATSRNSSQILSIDPKTLSWQLWETGFRVAFARGIGGRVMAASLFDGLLLPPEGVSAEGRAK